MISWTGVLCCVYVVRWRVRSSFLQNNKGNMDELFEKEECFDGDVLKKRHVQSVPDILIKFSSMILEGAELNRSLSTSLHKISTNIAQLIRFNSVKRKISEKIRNLRKSTKNKPPLAVLVGPESTSKLKRVVSCTS